MKVEILRQIASKQGIKYYGKYNKSELAKILGIDISNDTRKANKNSIPVYMTNLDTGKKIICSSIYQCAKLMDKTPSLISYYLKTGKTIKGNIDNYKIVKA